MHMRRYFPLKVLSVNAIIVTSLIIDCDFIYQNNYFFFEKENGRQNRQLQTRHAHQEPKAMQKKEWNITKKIFMRY